MTEYVRIRSEDPLVLEEGPCPLPAAYEGFSGFHHLPDEELSTFGWLPFVREDAPDFDAEQEELISTMVHKEDSVHLVHEVKALPAAVLAARVEAAREERLADLARLRWEHEVAGFRWDGSLFHSDRESQASLMVASIRGVDRNWKLKDGSWRELSVDELERAAEALVEFLEACFQKEAELSVLLNQAESLDAIRAVDLEAGWKEIT